MSVLNDETTILSLYDEIGRYIYHHCGRDMWEDLLAETFLKLVDYIKKTGKDPDSVRGLTYQIARNLLKDYYIDSPARKYYKIADTEPKIEDVVYDGAALLESADEIERVFSAINKLPPRNREVLYLQICGFEVKEIVGRTGYTHEAIKRYLRDGKMKLLAMLSDNKLQAITNEKKNMILLDADGNKINYHGDYGKWI